MVSHASQYDVVIAGGGHNGLTAAAYLARAGYSVLLLERADVLGGAAISGEFFPGVRARLSRYSYLLSLFPAHIRQDLDLNFETKPRRFRSYIPDVRGPEARGLLIHGSDAAAVQAAYRAHFGDDSEYEGYRRYAAICTALAAVVWPSLTEPLISRTQMQERFSVSPETWRAIFEEPLAHMIEREFKDDLTRGAFFSDGKIGTLTHPGDATMQPNRTFIYHVIGGGTGDWDVPVGGMSAVSGALAEAALRAGAICLTGAAVTAIDPEGSVAFEQGGQAQTVKARYVLANLSRRDLYRLMGQPDPAEEAVEGSSFKINMILKRLPRLKSGVDPRDAFVGSFHLNEGYEHMKANYQVASRGEMPSQPSGDLYCHSLTDPSVLAPELVAQGYQGLTLFGLDMPARLFRANPDEARAAALRGYLAGLQAHCDESLEDCIALDRNGNLCIEAKSALDLEAEVGLPAGHIFHRDLTWPYAEAEAELGTWGVETDHPKLLICGSAARRGGCVSGVPGHNAAMKVLELEGRR